MKTFILVFAVLAVARAGVVVPGIVELAPPHSSHQYFYRDANGQYTYGYATGQTAKHEARSADGQTFGEYSYVDPEGKLQSVHYGWNSVDGFRVAATNLPVGPSPIEVPLPEPVHDLPEVVEARAKHLEALRQAEEDAKKSVVEVKSAIHAHPAIITAPKPAVIRTAAPALELGRVAPIIATPSFGYSFGISHGGLNFFSLLPEPVVTAYAAPGHLIAAPSVAEALPEPAKKAEVVEAKAKSAEPQESSKDAKQEAKE